MGKRSAHKSSGQRLENEVQAAITTLHRYGWDVTLQDGSIGDEGEEGEAVVRALLISPWQPKELVDLPEHGLLGGRDL